MAGLVDWLANRVTLFTVARLVDWLAHMACDVAVAGLIDRFADVAGDRAVAGLIDRFANRVTLITVAGLVDVPRARYRHGFCALVIDRFHARVLLCFPHNFLNSVTLRTASASCRDEIAT